MRVLSVVGVRPQFIKSAPVSVALREAGVHEQIVHTGQHYDSNMSSVFFAELEIAPPSHHLNAGSGTHAEQTAIMLRGLERILIDEAPDQILVYGDTNSTLSGALAGAKLDIPICHVEAGVRSFNRAMPEEINRILTDRVARLLLCPSETAKRHLKAEGISSGVHVVGDVMRDALETFLPISERTSRILQTLALEPSTYDLLTVHRAENTSDAVTLERIFRALTMLGHHVIWPVHPRTRLVLERAAISPPRNVRLLDPVGYLDMLALEQSARVVLTDSGGVQKEAYWLGVPCVTLREQTEWPETVEAGCNVLVGSHPAAIDAAVRGMCESPPQNFGLPLYGAVGASARSASLIAGL